MLIRLCIPIRIPKRIRIRKIPIPQVNIAIEDVNDNPPEFDSSTVRISVPENAELNTPLYAANAHDKDSGKSGIVTYRLQNVDTATAATASAGSSASSTAMAAATIPSTSLFAIDARSGHLTLSRHLDYETAQRHQLVVLATDGGEPPLSANLTILVDVQDINDNAPVFERNEYAVKVLESMAVNSQVSGVGARAPEVAFACARILNICSRPKPTHTHKHTDNPGDCR